MNSFDSTRSVLVYKKTLLAYSEIFIPHQLENVPGYTPHYYCHEWIGGALPARRLKINPAPAWLRSHNLFKHDLDPHARSIWHQLRPDLVHAHFGPDGLLAARFSQRRSAPLIVTFHGYDVTVKVPHGRAHRQWLDRPERLFASAHKLIAVSDFVKHRLEQMGAPPEKVVRHYIGVRTQTLVDRASEQRSILFVGRLFAGKGILDVIRATALVSERLAGVTLTVVGDGIQRDDAIAEAARLRVNLRLLGAQPADTVRELMMASRVLCVASQKTEDGWEEAFGMVYAEAQSVGLPVVSYRSGGVGEAVHHGVGGLLSDEGDVEDLARNLVQLLDDDVMQMQMRLAGHRDMAARFNLDRQGETLADIYDAALSVKRTGQ